MIEYMENFSTATKHLNADNSAVLVLAAGRSQRMGSPKFALQFTNKQSFLERIITIYSSLRFGQILVVINSDDCKHSILSHIKEHYGHIQIVVNEYPEKGRLYSVQLGLCQLTKPFCFVQNVDNPFISENVLNKLLVESNPFRIVMPCFQDKNGHPIVIPERYHQGIVNELATETTLKKCLSGFQKQQIEVDDESILLNLNTPMDYQHYFGHPPLPCIG